MPTFDTVDRGWLMTRLVLVRHGHVDGIKPERFRGRMDLPLTAEGGRQAHATAAYPAFLTAALSERRICGKPAELRGLA